MSDDDLIRRGDALAAIALGDTVNQLQSKILAIPSAAIPAEPAEDVRAGARIIPMHTQSRYGVCIGGRWDGWVMFKHPDGCWVSHNKPDPIDPAATFNLNPEANP